MNRLFDLGNQYIQESDWKVMAVLKLCMTAVGILIGIQIPKKAKTATAIISSIVFIVTDILLMVKLVKLVIRKIEDHSF